MNVALVTPIRVSVIETNWGYVGVALTDVGLAGLQFPGPDPGDALTAVSPAGEKRRVPGPDTEPVDSRVQTSSADRQAHCKGSEFECTDPESSPCRPRHYVPSVARQDTTRTRAAALETRSVDRRSRLRSWLRQSHELPPRVQALLVNIFSLRQKIPMRNCQFPLSTVRNAFWT